MDDERKWMGVCGGRLRRGLSQDTTTHLHAEGDRKECASVLRNSCFPKFEVEILVA